MPSAFFDIGGIVDAKLAELWATLAQHWAVLWAPVWDGWPLWWSYGVFGLVLLGCLLIGFFLQFKWARFALGMIVLIAAGWLVGRHTMHTEMKAKLDAARKKRR